MKWDIAVSASQTRALSAWNAQAALAITSASSSTKTLRAIRCQRILSHTFSFLLHSLDHKPCYLSAAMALSPADKSSLKHKKAYIDKVRSMSKKWSLRCETFVQCQAICRQTCSTESMCSRIDVAATSDKSSTSCKLTSQLPNNVELKSVQAAVLLLHDERRWRCAIKRLTKTHDTHWTDKD